VELRVPDGVRLNLRVGHGRIAVGEGFSVGKLVRRPVAAASIRARNEPKTRGLFGEGDIIIDTANSSRVADGDLGPIPLPLYATGQIELRAENTLIKPGESDPPSSFVRE
jgi:hypothetical protein